MSLPPSEIPLGAIRFNSDSSKLEYWNGNAWFQIQTFSPNLGDTQSTAGARGLFTGGSTPTKVNTIDYVTISSGGDALDFGDLATTTRAHGAAASRIRGLNGGGNPASGGGINTIEFVTISSTGNSQDFGDLTSGRNYLAAVNNATRGLFCGAWGPNRSNIIDYVLFATTGNADDFGDLTEAQQTDGSFSSPTRGFLVGGAAGSGPDYQASTTGTQIECVTTTTLGNAFDFGDLMHGTFGKVGASNSTRGLTAGGYGSPAILDIEFIQMATLGNASSFGDIVGNGYGFYYGAGTSDTTRALFAGGNPAVTDIEYVNISTQGNSVVFGDLTQGRTTLKGISNANGGLG